MIGNISAEIDNGKLDEAIVLMPVGIPTTVAADVVISPLILFGVIAYGELPTREMYQMGYDNARHKSNKKR